MDGLPLTHNFANGHQVVIQGREHFHQVCPTAGDTPCSVKRVLCITEYWNELNQVRNGKVTIGLLLDEFNIFLFNFKRDSIYQSK